LKPLIAFLLLCGCAGTPPSIASRSQIAASTRHLISQREHWPHEAFINPQQDKYDGTWRVEVHEFGEPIHHGEILFVPGTDRELLFSRSGRLISYYAPPHG
jgi:hypothetical protein